jgi:Ca-activated chloride channel family protein
VLSPLTTDKNALKMYLESMVPDSVSAQGSDFGAALNEAKDAFKRGGVEGDEMSTVTKAILLVSDGEDLAGQGVKVSEDIKKLGIHIFSLAVGTEKGGPIPIRDGNGTTRGYRKDRDGKVILTQASDKSLKEIASVGGGSFYHLSIGSNIIQQLKSDLDKLEKAEFENAEMVDYNERYQIFLLLGLLIAALDFALGERKKTGRIWRGRFEVMQ